MSLELTFKLLFLLNILLDLSLLSEDLVREWKAFTLLVLSLWISVLNIMDYKAAILTNSEEVVVVVTESHSLNSLGMCLNLVDLVKLHLSRPVLRDLEDADSSWLVWLSNTGKACLSVVSDRQLGDDGLDLEWLLAHVVVPDSSVITSSEDLVLFVWDACNTCQLNTLLGEILVRHLCVVLVVDQVPEVHITSLTSRHEAHVIIEPADCSDSLLMPLTEEVWWTLSSVEIVHLRSCSSRSNSKEMPSI